MRYARVMTSGRVSTCSCATSSSLLACRVPCMSRIGLETGCCWLARSALAEFGEAYTPRSARCSSAGSSATLVLLGASHMRSDSASPRASVAGFWSSTAASLPRPGRAGGWFIRRGTRSQPAASRRTLPRSSSACCSLRESAERAWSAPFELRRRLGRLDAGRMCSEPNMSVARRRPRRCCTVSRTPFRWIGCSQLVGRTRSTAGIQRIWPAAPIRSRSPSACCASGARGEEVGDGRRDCTETLRRRFRGAAVAVGSTSMSRCGACTLEAASLELPERQSSGRARVPDAPGTLRLLAAHGSSGETCRPRAPKCPDCRLGIVCPATNERTGSRRGVARV